MVYPSLPNVYTLALNVCLGFMQSNNTFQGILIADDFSTSYAVFIYECGGMDWGGATIGWQYNTSDYESHYLSREAKNNEIGCLYSSTYSAIFYRLSEYGHVLIC